MGNGILGKKPEDMTDTERQVEQAADAQRRAQNCLIDIKNCLGKWECVIDPVVQIAGNQISSSYMVVPLLKIPTGMGAGGKSN